MLNDLIRVTATFLGVASNVRQWVWNYRQTAGDTPDYDLLLDDIELLLEEAFSDVAGFMQNTVAGVDLALATYDAVTGQFDTIRTRGIPTLVGTNVTDVMPGNVAPYVSFPTNIGRSTGKKFLFDIAESYITSSLPIASLLAAMATFAARFNSPVTDGTTTWRACNLNPTTGDSKLWRLDTVGVGAVAGSQYRRILGIGA